MEPRTCFQKLIDINKILDSDLSYIEKLVLIKIAMYNDCYITNKQLSTSLKISMTAIKDAIATLKEKKVIETTRTTKANSKMQQRKVTGIDFDGLNNNAMELQEKNQRPYNDPLLFKSDSEEQRPYNDPLLLSDTGDEHAQPCQRLEFSEQRPYNDPLLNHEKTPTNGVIMPQVKLSEQRPRNNPEYYNNKIINKTISVLAHTHTQDNGRSEFPVHKNIQTTNAKTRFVKPTPEEVRAYCQERGNTIDPEYFCDYYESVGWVVGKNRPMKDWKAAVRTWERNEKKHNIVRLPTGQARQEYKQSWYDKDAEIRRAAVMAATKNDK